MSLERAERAPIRQNYSGLVDREHHPGPKLRGTQNPNSEDLSATRYSFVGVVIRILTL